MGLIRQLYQVFALVAVLNVLGGAGLAGFLATSGQLTPDRARQMIRALRGELDGAEGQSPAPRAGGKTEGGAETEPASAEPGAQAGHSAADPGEPGQTQRPLATALDRSREARMDREIILRERNRFEAEINQRLALSNSIMLQITSKLDGLHDEMDAFERKKLEESGFRDTEGFKKELEVFNTLKPGQAFEYLLLKEVTEAARLLMEMDPRTVAKILESAKSDEQKKKADEILQKIRAVSPAQADQVAGVP